MSGHSRNAFAAACLALCLYAPWANSAPDDSAALFAKGVSALSRGAYDEAVDSFELLSDQGFVHPDASFNRATAYIERARTPATRAGDLGQAAQALAETVHLDPTDAEAQTALDGVRAEIARRRSRTGAEPIAARPSLGRAVVSLLPELGWGIVTGVGSLLVTVGLLLRLLSSARRPRLAGVTAAAIGATLLVTGSGLGLAARSLRLSSKPAVVVVSEARLLDGSGRPLPQSLAQYPAIPEGASVFVLETRGGLSRVEWGSTEAWVAKTQLRRLAEP